jgi:arabinose-5-phosphate isomerase
MITGNSVPIVDEDTGMEETIKIINKFSLGTTLVQGKDKKLTGIITDGDIRRHVASKKNIFEVTAGDVMTKDPRKLLPESPAYDALNMMEQYQITALPITDKSGQILGILHLHDILGKGAFKFNGK